MMCDTCIANKDMCLKCIYNPMYKDLRSYFKGYEPTCPRGYDDCVYDPAYIKYNHPERYAELYGDKAPEEASKNGICQTLEEYYCYNNEDK